MSSLKTSSNIRRSGPLKPLKTEEAQEMEGIRAEPESTSEISKA